MAAIDSLKMKDFEIKKLLDASWELHRIVEESYLTNGAIKGEPLWLEKQRILLADMALHLLQTAVNPGEIEIDKLKNNIYSILTISDQFLPEAELTNITEGLYKNDS